MGILLRRATGWFRVIQLFFSHKLSARMIYGIKGDAVPMPAPGRAVFLKIKEGKDNDDDRCKAWHASVRQAAFLYKRSARDDKCDAVSIHSIKNDN